LTGREIVPDLSSPHFHHGLIIVLSTAIELPGLGTVASLLRGPRDNRGHILEMVTARRAFQDGE
jgi:hypothetical protein